MSKIVANSWSQEKPEQCTDRTDRIVTSFMAPDGSFAFTSVMVFVR